MRRPIGRAVQVTGDTASHASYGVGPATDYALAVGDDVIAPFAMTLTSYRSSTGGWSLEGVGSLGIVDFQHLVYSSRRTGSVAEGTVIASIAGASDNPGTAWEGPHLHCWVTRTARQSFEEFVAALGFRSAPIDSIATPTLTSSAGGGAIPFPDTEKPKPIQETDMFEPRYLERASGPGNKTEWAIIWIGLPNGFETTQDVKVANGWGNLDRTGGKLTDDAHWKPTLDTAQRFASLYWKQMAAAVHA